MKTLSERYGFEGVSCDKTLDFYPVKAYNKSVVGEERIDKRHSPSDISIISREERVRLCRNVGKVNDWN